MSLPSITTLINRPRFFLWIGASTTLYILIVTLFVNFSPETLRAVKFTSDPNFITLIVVGTITWPLLLQPKIFTGLASQILSGLTTLSALYWYKPDTCQFIECFLVFAHIAIMAYLAILITTFLHSFRLLVPSWQEQGELKALMSGVFISAGSVLGTMLLMGGVTSTFGIVADAKSPVLVGFIFVIPLLFALAVYPLLFRKLRTAH